MTSTDDWGNATLGDPLTFSHVRIDRTTVYSGTNNDRQIVANATVFIYADYSEHDLSAWDDWLKGQAEFDDHVHAIVAVNKLAAVGTSKIWALELGVL